MVFLLCKLEGNILIHSICWSVAFIFVSYLLKNAFWINYNKMTTLLSL